MQRWCNIYATFMQHLRVAKWGTRHRPKGLNCALVQARARFLLTRIWGILVEYGRKILLKNYSSITHRLLIDGSSTFLWHVWHHLRCFFLVSCLVACFGGPSDLCRAISIPFWHNVGAIWLSFWSIFVLKCIHILLVWILIISKFICILELHMRLYPTAAAHECTFHRGFTWLLEALPIVR